MPSKAQTLADMPRSISWLGMERVRNGCLGIVVLEIGTLFPNEAPRSKLRGISGAELRRSPTRLRSHELRRGRLAIPLCSKLQSILAKANEKGLLTPREAARAEKLGPRRRKLFVAARVALKTLARRIGVAAEDRPDSSIETLGPDGVRPCLAESGLCCSVSHTDHFAVAVGHDRSVGVDIEAVSPKSLRVWHLFMPSGDRHLLSRSAMGPDRTATRAWTIKEASAKAFGLDLSEAIREVEIILVGELESAIKHRGKTYPVRHAEGDGQVLSLLTWGGY